MPDIVSLIVNGFRYEGWKSIRITRSIESIAGSFALDVSDRWDGKTAPWPIAEGDECRVEINGKTVIDGFVKRRRLSASKEERSLSYEGRDRAAELVDCSAIVDAGTVSKNKWTFSNVNVFELATKIAKPFGVKVSLQAGLGALLTKNAKIVMQPGDTCFEVISKIAAAVGVLVVSDGAGGIMITRTGTARAASLVERENILTASLDSDVSNRFYRYLISSQMPGTDDASGEATRIQAEVFDAGVTQTARVLLIRPDKGYSAAESKRRADWEARIRAAKADTVTIMVQGWRQPNGELWPINALCRVRAPHFIGVEGDLLISQVEYSVGDGGNVTQISLVRPDAFTPEPATVKQSGGAWKELAKGAL